MVGNYLVYEDEDGKWGYTLESFYDGRENLLKRCGIVLRGVSENKASEVCEGMNSLIERYSEL